MQTISSQTKALNCPLGGSATNELLKEPLLRFSRLLLGKHWRGREVWSRASSELVKHVGFYSVLFRLTNDIPLLVFPPRELHPREKDL